MLKSSPGYFLDLDVPYPFEPAEVFSDEDYELFSTPMDSPETRIHKTTNIDWLLTPDSSIGNAGFLSSNKFKRRVRDYCNDVFRVDMFSDPLTTHFGKAIYPVTFLKFNQDAHWHREGITNYMRSNPLAYDLFSPSRIAYCINFKMHGTETDSAVEFAEPDQQVLDWEKTGIDYCTDQYQKQLSGELPFDTVLSSNRFSHVLTDENDSPYFVNYLNRSGFAGDAYALGDSHVTIKARKSGYTTPYAINLEKYHRVLLEDGLPRVSFRLQCDGRLSFSDMEKLNEQGLLVNRGTAL